MDEIWCLVFEKKRYFTGNLGQCTFWWFFAEEKKTRMHPYDSTWWGGTQNNSHKKMKFFWYNYSNFHQNWAKIEKEFWEFLSYQYFNLINWILDSIYYMKKIDCKKVLQNIMFIYCDIIQYFCTKRELPINQTNNWGLPNFLHWFVK